MSRKQSPKVPINGHEGWCYKFGLDNYSLDIRYDNGNIVESHRERYATGKYYFVALGKISGKHYNSHKEALQAGVDYYLKHHQSIAEQLQMILDKLSEDLEK